MIWFGPSRNWLPGKLATRAIIRYINMLSCDNRIHCTYLQKKGFYYKIWVAHSIIEKPRKQTLG